MKRKLLIYALLLAFYIALANAINIAPMPAIIAFTLMSHVFYPMSISFVMLIALKEFKKVKHTCPFKVFRVIVAILVVTLWMLIPYSSILSTFDIIGAHFP